MVENRGNETATISYTTAGGAGSTTEIGPAKVVTLPYQVEVGKAVSNTYSAISVYFPDIARTVTYDTSTVVTEEIVVLSSVVFSVTDADYNEGEGIVTLHNPNPDTGYTILWSTIGGSEENVEIDPQGSFDLPTAITIGNTIGSVYDYAKVQQDGVDVFEVDMSTTLAAEAMTILIVPATPTYTVTFEAYAGVPQPEQQGIPEGEYVTEPPAPSIPQESMPQGYLGDGASNGWWVGSTPWIFATTPVTADVTLSTYYDVFRTITVLDEPAGAQMDTAYARYSFSQTPLTGNDFVDYIADPTDPSGQGRQFAGWKYESGDEEHSLVFDQYFPDGGDIPSGAIPTTVTEIYATWEAYPTTFNFTLPSDSELPVAIVDWGEADTAGTGSVTWNPYIGVSEYGYDFDNLVNSTSAGTVESCSITQGVTEYLFETSDNDTFTLDGATVEMLKGDASYRLTMCGDWAATENYITIDDTDAPLNKEMDPNGTAAFTLVLSESAENTEMSYLIDQVSDTNNIFLAQSQNPSCKYTCNFSKVVSAGSAAAVRFEVGTSGGPDYEILELDYTWDTDNSNWIFRSVGAQTGFSNVIITAP